MRRFVLSVVTAWVLNGAIPSLLIGEDEITTTLSAAKEAHAEAVTNAQAAFLVDFEKAVEKLNLSTVPTDQKVNSLKQLTSEKEAFLQSWARPKHSLLNPATEKFQKEVKTARKELETAFDQAAQAYDKQQNLESAARILEEKATLQRRIAAIEEPQFVKIANVASKKLIAVPAGAAAPGTGLLQWRPAGFADQVWQLIPVEEEWFLIRNRRSGLVMGIGSGSTDDGVPVIQWSQADVHDQHWKLEPVPGSGPETFMIVNRNSNKLISLEKESKDNGVKIIQHQLIEGALTQRWLLQR